MSTTIHKYQLHFGNMNDRGEIRVSMPAGARVLSCQVQAGTPTLWVVVDTEAGMVHRTFVIIGTGHTHSRLGKTGGFGLRFIDTVQMGGLVLHVFEA